VTVLKAEDFVNSVGPVVKTSYPVPWAFWVSVQCYMPG